MIFILGWTHPKDELTQQANVFLLKLVKNKEVLARNGGGKREKMNPVVILCFEKQYTTLEREIFFTLIPGLGKSFV